MKILVVGAYGFIGRRLVTKLEQLGYQVAKADIVRQGTDKCEVFSPDHPDFQKLFASQLPDVCINCTGAASVPASFDNPFNDYTLNTLRVIQMLEAIRMVSPGTRFIHFSSAAVYGNPLASPISETADIAPLSPYGWHKRSAELACQEYYALYQVQSLSLRVFSAYGPGLKKQIFWDVYQKALASKQVELFGTGLETRDFIYVDDIAVCVDTLIRHAVFDARAVNVANGEASTIADAVSTLLEALNFKRDVMFSGAGRQGDPSCWQADVSYLSSLGFTPAYSLKQGLAEVARWMAGVQ
ncbi:NAD-dependent epimerase/dehydratase family protein [Pseudomonas arcuscaelestis]|jgi:dTDP-glucose 4,6-dehydratase/UDP-glucose 4-epimerase|uniref:NAD-dependent epimerase/dehydratase family protein n=1 Tax=Pseudomonas arcuscaelestis TaxID=2710591 RepID=UPI00193CFFD5|nr:NAD-dependent epimerase/dehydratase family protein [Pseudomonas arcuscaelestis]MBM3111568.1 NAD-dependent epimerase/dehydratase family protein [Pseudomonas arcuscaelestis]